MIDNDKKKRRHYNYKLNMYVPNNITLDHSNCHNKLKNLVLLLCVFYNGETWTQRGK